MAGSRSSAIQPQPGAIAQADFHRDAFYNGTSWQSISAAIAATTGNNLSFSRNSVAESLINQTQIAGVNEPALMSGRGLQCLEANYTTSQTASDEMTLNLATPTNDCIIMCEFEADYGWGVDNVFRHIFTSRDAANATLQNFFNSDDSGNRHLFGRNLPISGFSSFGLISGSNRLALRVKDDQMATIVSNKTMVTGTGVAPTIAKIDIGHNASTKHANTIIKSLAIVDPSQWTDTEFQNWADAV